MGQMSEKDLIEALRILMGPHRKIGACDDCGLYRLIELEDGEPIEEHRYCPECGQEWRM